MWSPVRTGGYRCGMDELLELEHAGWRSLCEGTGSDFYGSTMTDHALMVLANGTVMDRRQVVDALAQSPVWAGYEIADARTVALGAGSAALVYVGTGKRDEGADVVCVMTSVYVRSDDGWRLALYQQTPIPQGDGGG